MTSRSSEKVERRLLAILAADVAGYSRIMGTNEEAALAVLRECRTRIDSLIEELRGQIVNTAGDSVLAQFESPVEAVRCAQAIQERLRELNDSLPDEQRMEFRIGIHLGDVMVGKRTIYGDAVNVAARLEGIAEPGGILVSQAIFDHVKNKIAPDFDDLGVFHVKNIEEPVRVFEVRTNCHKRPISWGRARYTRLKPAHWVGIGVFGVLFAQLIGFGVWSVGQQLVPGENASTTSRLPATLRMALKASLLPKALKHGQSIELCPACPELVVIGPGEFEMGSPFTETDRRENEGPRHVVKILRAFAIGKFEVTFAQWDACIASGGCSHKPQDRGWGRSNRPVMYVSWSDTQVYLKWLSAIPGQAFRLPSEAEWEFAARAGSQSKYWWGDEIGRGRAVCEGCGDHGEGRTLPVGSLPPNPFGIHDIHGNVWEWVEDCWIGSFVSAPKDGSAWTVPDCRERTLKGGSWGAPASDLRLARRRGNKPDLRSGKRGFRVAMTLPSGT